MWGTTTQGQARHWAVKRQKEMQGVISGEASQEQSLPQVLQKQLHGKLLKQR